MEEIAVGTTWIPIIGILDCINRDIDRITRHDGEEDDITSQSFDNYDDAYELLEEIYGDMCCSDADYEDRPYYEIIEVEQ